MIEKKNAPTSVSVVDATQLALVPTPSIEGSLQAKVTGRQSTVNNGAPGGGGQVQIRGASSLSGRTEPLFVVDGVIVPNNQRPSRQSVAAVSSPAAKKTRPIVSPMSTLTTSTTSKSSSCGGRRRSTHHSH